MSKLQNYETNFQLEVLFEPEDHDQKIYLKLRAGKLYNACELLSIQPQNTTKANMYMGIMLPNNMSLL